MTMWIVRLNLLVGVAASTFHRKFFASPDQALMPVHESLSEEGKTALHKLLHDFVEAHELAGNASFGVKKGKLETVDEFTPKCLAHVKELVNAIDHTYTDAQLKNVLLQECQLSKEFPHSHSSNFQSHDACIKFAGKLSDARIRELDTGKTEQYKEFCTDYYNHAAIEGQRPALEEQELPKAASAPANKTKPDLSDNSGSMRALSRCFTILSILGLLKL
mmetsp:Transcript_64249/g.101897  ORF Transcript_64249/g.101897 Transcript_64249/m.101897 type:complete len:219 (+) Transcript_64249:62-718(+)